MHGARARHRNGQRARHHHTNGATIATSVFTTVVTPAVTQSSPQPSPSRRPSHHQVFTPVVIPVITPVDIPVVTTVVTTVVITESARIQGENKYEAIGASEQDTAKAGGGTENRKGNRAYSRAELHRTADLNREAGRAQTRLFH